MAGQHGLLALACCAGKLRSRGASDATTSTAPNRKRESNHKGLPHSLASPSAARRPPGRGGDPPPTSSARPVST
eukprot:2406782-Prymnesium_polylepis.1